jgi:hypothetical protein
MRKNLKRIICTFGLRHYPFCMRCLRAMTSWSIFINGCVRRCFSPSLSLFFSSIIICISTYATVDEQYLSYTHIHRWTFLRSASISHFFFSDQYSLPLYLRHTHTHKEKERYGGNYWRIIECWHILLISCLPMLLLECDRFMQHCCIYICHMNDRAYEHSQPMATNTRHNVVVV